MKLVTIVLDTVAGKHLTDSLFIPSSRKSKIKRISVPSLSTAGRQSISAIGVIMLHFCIGDVMVRAWFGVVDNLAVFVTFRISFIDRFVKGIFPSERKVVPYHSKTVTIMTSFENDTIYTIVFEDEVNDSDGAFSRVARHVWLRLVSETLFLVHTTYEGFMHIESHPNIVKPRVAVTESGILNVVPGRPLHLVVAYFAERLAHYPKHMLATVGSGAPQYLVHMAD